MSAYSPKDHDPQLKMSCYLFMLSPKVYIDHKYGQILWNGALHDIEHPMINRSVNKNERASKLSLQIAILLIQ